MKLGHTFILSILSLSIVAFPQPSIADECKMPLIKTSADFSKLTPLVGKWSGTSPDSPEQKFEVDFKLTSGGTALVETLFAGSPHEMVSVYHDEHGKLAMTHYCSIGNQPNMILKSSSDKSFEFLVSEKSPLNVKKDMHMHSLRLTIIDKDTIVENWSAFDKGMKQKESVFKLTRSS